MIKAATIAGSDASGGALLAVCFADISMTGRKT